MDRVTRWRSLAEASASRWGSAFGVAVPVPLVLGVIRKESSGNPDALGDGGRSRGLMQVLDSTALELGLRDLRQLFVPAIGVDYGVRYLARQLARYRGNVASAVAAYNAGSARFTERETYVNQGYVDQVLAFARMYGRQLGGGILVPLAGAALLAWALSRSRQRRRRLAA